MKLMSEEEFGRKRDDFVQAIVPWLQTQIEPEAIVKGVAFVPFQKQGEEIVLGKERWGHYRNLWNFFGGSLQDKASNRKHPTYEDIATGLFEETVEEFGVILEGEVFLKNVLGLYRVGVRRKLSAPLGESLLFLVAMQGFDPNQWRHQMEQREETPECPKCWKEHKDAIVVGEQDIQLNTITSYVKGFYARLFMTAREKWQAGRRGMSYGRLEKIIAVK